MYDSRSKHPRNGIHKKRAERKEDYYRMPVRPVPTKQRHIQEQISALLDPDTPARNIPGLKRLRGQGFGRMVCEEHVEASGMARWEAELLRICTEDCQWVWSRSLGVTKAEEREWEERDAEQEGIREAEMITWEMAPWEVGLPDNVVWSDALTDSFWAEVERNRPEPMDSWDDPWEGESMYADDSDDSCGTPWLPIMTTTQACHELGDFIIEGPSVAPRPTKGEGEQYFRVHEVARRMGIPSSELVRRLRLEGEYVKGPMSLIAKPVADRFARCTCPTDDEIKDASERAIALLREKLMGENA